MRFFRRAGVVGGTRRVVAAASVAALCVAACAPALHAANITWQTPTDFDVGNLDLSGTVVQAINFGNTSQTVTVNGNTATFVASTSLSPLNLGFPSSNDGAAGQATFANVVGNQPLINVLASHAFNGPEDTQLLTLSGLIAGQSYQLQTFMFDGRTTGTPTLNAAPFHLSDGAGNNSTSTTRGAGTIFLGTFTANATTQDLFVISELTGAPPAAADPALSGLVLRALTGGAVTASLNRATGQLTLANGAASPVDMIGYSVTSAYGGLSQTSWLSVLNNYDKPSAPTPGNGSIDGNDAWNILSDPASHGDLSEAEFAGGNGGAIGAGATLDLGNVWIKSPTEDVTVKLVRGDGSLHQVPVAYTGNGGVAYKAGDFNFDGALTATDWTIYIAAAQTNLSALSLAEAYQMGDLNGNRANNLADLDLFIEAYDAANGVGAFAAMAAGVPEPSAAALVGLAVAALAPWRRRLRGAARCGGLLLAAGACLAAWPAQAQVTLNPIITSGHDQDVVYEVGLAAGEFGANGEFGSRQFYEEGISTQVAGTHKQGLPRTVTGFVSAVTGNTINFGFQPFEENNILKFELNAPQKSLTLAVPKAYSTLAVAFSGGSLAIPGELGQLSYTINYSAGPVQTGMLLAPDWGTFALDNPAFPAGVEVLYRAGRMNGGATGGTAWPITPEGEAPTTNPERWRIYATEIPITNLGANVLSVDFHTPMLFNTATQAVGPLVAGDDIVVFGLAGPGTVEPTLLNLQVNKSSGLIQITNPTMLTFEMNGYEVASAMSSLNVGGWNSLSDQNVDAIGGGTGQSWDEAGGSSNAALLEGFLLGHTTIAPGGSLSLGSAYNTSVSVEDLVFRYRRTNGAVSAGTVAYETGGGAPGDFDGNGVVDGVDFLRWQRGDGVATNPTTLAEWRNNYGTGAAEGAAGAVPEPAGGALALIGCGMATVVRRRTRRERPATAAPARRVLLLCAACLTVVGTARAAVTIDREYRLGDDAAEDAGNAVQGQVGTGPANANPGATLDSAGVPGTGTLHDLFQAGNPVYEDVGPTGLNRPGAAANSRGIRLDGLDDYLFGERFGYPGTSDSSSGGSAGGTQDYVGLYNRGFQLWVRPNPGVTTLRDVVADTNQHGVRINAAGNWVLRYNNADVTTTMPAATNAWSHVMVVRPKGTATPGGGAILYVNGVAIAASAGGYNAADDIVLVVGANTGATPGTANYFNGVVDQLTLFTMGKTPNGANRGTYNFGTDNGFAAQPSGLGGLTGVAGDVNQDGAVTQADVTAFVDGWLTEKRVNNVRVGDKTTILNGDLNFDGITDIADAHQLNTSLILAAGVGLDFSSLPAPEPAGSTLCAWLLAVGAARRPRRAGGGSVVGMRRRR